MGGIRTVVIYMKNRGIFYTLLLIIALALGVAWTVPHGDIYVLFSIAIGFFFFAATEAVAYEAQKKEIMRGLCFSVPIFIVVMFLLLYILHTAFLQTGTASLFSIKAIAAVIAVSSMICSSIFISSATKKAEKRILEKYSLSREDLVTFTWFNKKKIINGPTQKR